MKCFVPLVMLIGLTACAEAHDTDVALQSQKLLAASDVDAGADDVDAGTAQTAIPRTLTFADIGPVQAVSQQFQYAEGPVWDPAQNVLYVSDINGRAIYRLTLPDTVTKVWTLNFDPDGLALDQNGQLLVAGYAGRIVGKLSSTGLDLLANTYQGSPLNSPDDLTVRSDGIIYFTDPTFGLLGTPTLSNSLSFQGVYMITPAGTISLLDQTSAEGPNGVSLSPDEKTLYVSYTTSGKVSKYAVRADGSLGARQAFASGVTTADSMCVDTIGDVYVASSAGIVVFDPSGKRLGTISTQRQVPTNCAFGGADQRTMFITAGRTLFAIPNMPIPGIPGRT